MQRIDALICPRFTVRVAPHAAVETNLATAIDAGRILAVLPEAEANARFLPDARHERPHHVLMPGLVNAHCRAGATLMRGLAARLPQARWPAERGAPAEARWVTPELVADGTLLGIAEMLRGGITCFSDMYYYPEACGEAAIESGIRAVLGMIVLDAPSPWAETPDEYVSKGLAVHDRFKSEASITTTFAPHGEVADATLVRIRQLADELDVPIQMHLHASAAEVEQAVRRTGRRPLVRLHELGLVTPALIGLHATELAPQELELLAASGASVAHCPRTNMKQAVGPCPVAALARAGVNVALGTGSAASNDRLDLWSELQTAALLGVFVAGDAAAVGAADAIEMATINGARALNLDAQIGSLSEGKLADVICVDLGGLMMQPLFDPLAALVYAAERRDVTDVWVAGKHLVAEGAHTRLDVAAIASAARDWEGRLTSA